MYVMPFATLSQSYQDDGVTIKGCVQWNVRKALRLRRARIPTVRKGTKKRKMAEFANKEDPTQRPCNVEMTTYWRWCDMTSYRRRYDVISTSFRRARRIDVNTLSFRCAMSHRRPYDVISTFIWRHFDVMCLLAPHLDLHCLSSGLSETRELNGLSAGLLN